jgi:hypothetical protein
MILSKQEADKNREKREQRKVEISRESIAERSERFKREFQRTIPTTSYIKKRESWAAEVKRIAREKADNGVKNMPVAPVKQIAIPAIDFIIEKPKRSIDERLEDIDKKTSQLEDELASKISYVPSNMFISSGEGSAAWAFGCSVSGSELTVQAGRITIDGTIYKWDLAKYIGNISGPTTYAYPHIVLSRNLSSDPSIAVFDSIQDPTNSTVYKELVRLVSNDGGLNWRSDGDGYILHRGNWHITAPIVFG